MKIKLINRFVSILLAYTTAACGTLLQDGKFTFCLMFYKGIACNMHNKGL